MVGLCRSAVFTVVERGLVSLLCLVLLAGTAWAESGIRIKSGPTIVAGPANPPCDAMSIITYRVVIENTNCVCNEDVNPIRLAGVPFLESPPVSDPPFGAFEFLGFRKSLSDPLTPTIAFVDMEDESSEEFFFDVKTQPVSGCFPFKSAQFGIVICDSGGGCDFLLTADPPDPICESPKHMPTVRLDSDAIACASLPATGTGSIRGRVIDGASGNPVALALVDVTKGCFGAPGFVAQAAFSSPGWPDPVVGEYILPPPLLPGLPAGTYTLKAQEGGRCTSQTVTLADGEAKVVDITLGTAPSPCP